MQMIIAKVFMKMFRRWLRFCSSLFMGLGIALALFLLSGCGEKEEEQQKKLDSKQRSQDDTFLLPAIRILPPSFSVPATWHAWEIRSGGKPALQVEFHGEECFMESPIRAKADFSECEANIRNFLSMGAIATEIWQPGLAESGQSESEAFFAAFGAGPSSWQYGVTFQEAEGLKKFLFTEGKVVKEVSARYVLLEQNLERKAYLVREWFLLALQKKATDLLFKDFLPIKTAELLSIQGEGFIIEQAEPLRWILQGGKKERLDESAIDSFVQNFLFLRAESVLVLHGSLPGHQEQIERIRAGLEKKFSLQIQREDGEKKQYNLAVFQDAGAPVLQLEREPILYRLNKKYLPIFNYQREDFLRH